MPSHAGKSAKFNLDWAAQTILPIEFDGHELSLEARAYQGALATDQAIALINRSDEHTGTTAAAGVEAVIPLVRVHSGCVTGDIFHSLRCDCHQQLKASIARISQSPNGTLIYLPYQEGRGIGLVNKIRAYAMQDQGLDTVDANLAVGLPVEARDYSLAAHILRDLGFSQIRLITNNPAKVEALATLGIGIHEQVPLVVIPSRHNRRYLSTKRERMDHKI